MKLKGTDVWVEESQTVHHSVELPNRVLCDLGDTLPLLSARELYLDAVIDRLDLFLFLLPWKVNISALLPENIYLKSSDTQPCNINNL